MAEQRATARRGRPRSQATRDAILQATRQLLGEVGYTRLAFSEVAARAGAGRATIYRWWPTKGDLVLEAARERIDIGVVPDTGTTRGDLSVAVQQLIRTFSDRLASVVIFAAIGTADHDPDMARAFRDRHVYPWRSSAAQALDRGIARGDLSAKTDVGFVLDVIVGVVFQRTLVMKQPDVEDLTEKVLALVLPGA